MSKRHSIRHADAELALELNVQAFVEAEQKKMRQFKYAVRMKVSVARCSCSTTI